MNIWWWLFIPAVPLALLVAMYAGGKIGYKMGYQASEEERLRAIRLSKKQ